MMEHHHAGRDSSITMQFIGIPVPVERSPPNPSEVGLGPGVPQPRPLWAGDWAPGLAPTPETEPWGRSWGVQGAWAPVTEGTDDESRLDTYPGPAAG